MKKKYELIVIGSSAGGIQALEYLTAKLPSDFIAIAIVQHLKNTMESYLPIRLAKICKMKVKEAEEKELIQTGTVYIAPPGYHLLIEYDKTFSLSVDEKISFSRPSIDVLFESTAEVYGDKGIGIILSGANADGSNGLKLIKQLGGLTMVQKPSTAIVAYMPEAAIKATTVDYIVSLEEMHQLLLEIVML